MRTDAEDYMVLTFSESEYSNRQSAFLDQLPSNSLVLIPSNGLSVRSNDVTYPYRPNSYLMYLSGWMENEGVFVATSSKSGLWNTMLFVPPRDTEKEIWEGIRTGVEGAKNWPVDHTFSLEKLEHKLTGYINKSKNVYSFLGVNQRLDKFLTERVVRALGRTLLDPRPILNQMRLTKSQREIELMTNAAEIASAAHIVAMKATHPGIGEWQIQSLIEGYFMNERSQWSYPSIVGGGDNATILHYKSNDSVVNDGDLVLVDAGCEVEGYASDITRTWPVGGKFTEPQREIYELVLKAQLVGIEACQVGAPWKNIHEETSNVLAQGLIDLGILDCSLEEALGNRVIQPWGIEFDGPHRNFFMHGTGHLLGLDVHDVGGGRKGDKHPPAPDLEEGMVLTIEPGLYFGSWRSDVEIPKKYAGIGVRIEDDVLITKDGPVVLTANCPKQISELESIIGQEG